MEPNEQTQEEPFDWGEPIAVYTRAQAIDDGVLVDLSDRARAYGIRIPTACTSAIWAAYEGGHDPTQAAREILLDLRAAIRLVPNTTETDRVSWSAAHQDRQTGRFIESVDCYALVGPGDTAAPVLTIMIEGED
jgi:hypothetical protein